MAKAKVKWGRSSDISSIEMNEVKVQDIFDNILADNNSYSVVMKDLSDPIGDYGKVLLKNKEYKELFGALSKYYRFAGTPSINVYNILHKDGTSSPLCTRVYNTVYQKSSAIDIRKVFDAVVAGFAFDQVVTGIAENSVEFQFLRTSSTKEIEKGDVVMGGLLVGVNGIVRVSPVVHRVVCCNGLTERVFVMTGNKYIFNEDFFDRASLLMDWMLSQRGIKVTDIRELSAIFHSFPESFKNEFWKTWSEKISLGTLTRFDVISDITSFANGTLSDIRYRALAIRGYIKMYEEKKCCPTCSAGMHNE